MSKRVLVIGSANTDLVIHTDQMPVLGQTLTGGKFSVNAGGKGLNQAVAIRKLGGEVAFVGAVGKDANAQILLDTLADLQIPFRGFALPDVSTGVAMITVVNGDNFIVLHAGANEALTPQRIAEKRDLIQKSDYLVLQLEIPMDSVYLACRLAGESGTKIVLNPAPYKPLPEKLLTMVDYLIPNEHEAHALTGIYPDSPETCALAIEKLREMGAKCVVITLGERGCVYTDGTDIRFCAAVPTTPVDTTSAGDSFIGGFITKLAEGESIDDAVRFGTQVASITVSRHGAAASIPFAQELEGEVNHDKY